MRDLCNILEWLNSANLVVGMHYHSFGALVGMNGGQTLWLAPVDGKIRLFVTQDYVVPRKNGFWRVRLDVKWAP